MGIDQFGVTAARFMYEMLFEKFTGKHWPIRNSYPRTTANGRLPVHYDGLLQWDIDGYYPKMW